MPRIMTMLPDMAKGFFQMWLRTLRWGEYLGMARWARCDHQSLKVENLAQVRSEGLAEGGRGCETGNAGRLQKLGKAGKAILLPWNLRKGIKSCRHLHFRLVRFHVGLWLTERQDNTFVLFKWNQSNLSQWQHKMNNTIFRDLCFFH